MRSLGLWRLKSAGFVLLMPGVMGLLLLLAWRVADHKTVTASSSLFGEVAAGEPFAQTLSSATIATPAATKIESIATAMPAADGMTEVSGTPPPVASATVVREDAFPSPASAADWERELERVRLAREAQGAVIEAKLRARRQAYEREAETRRTAVENRLRERAEARTREMDVRRAAIESQLRERDTARDLREREAAHARAHPAATVAHPETPLIATPSRPLAERQARATSAAGETSAGAPSGTAAAPPDSVSAPDRARPSAMEDAVAQAASMFRRQWRIGVGYIWRTLHGRSVRTEDSYARSYALSDRARDDATRYGSPGDPSALGDRTYADGYVYQDDYTALDGGTWNWGYSSGGQVSGESLNLSWLSYTRTEFSRSTTYTSGEWADDQETLGGPSAQIEHLLLWADRLDYGLHLGVQRLAWSDAQQFETFRDEQEWTAWNEYSTDVYTLSGTGITPGGAPYTGDLTTPGPVIDNLPVTRVEGATRRETDAGSSVAYNTVDQALDMAVTTVSLGVTLGGQYRRLSLAGVAGPTFNLLAREVAYEEHLYESRDGQSASELTSWSAARDYTDAAWGLFAQGQMGLRLMGGLGVELFGRYDWLETIAGTVGMAQYEVNPEGGSFGGHLNYTF